MKLLAMVLVLMTLAAAPATMDESVRFMTVDVLIDAKGKPLAAYQVEFVADPNRVKLVGVEGGENKSFSDPPYYDPAALSRNRVIVAAFNTTSDLPRARFRAARLHLQIIGSNQPTWEAKLIVAAAADGSSIPAAVTLAEGAGK
jgi:hypothetical protein